MDGKVTPAVQFANTADLPMEETLPKRARFGSFSLDLKAGELRSGSTALLLQEQPLQVLRILVENDGALVSREEIRKRLWPNDTVVEFEHSINAAINKLRKALGDPVAEPQYIQTVARRGYRLMVPVEWEGPSATSPRAARFQVGTMAQRCALGWRLEF
jgi:DNA-binding winged helix-turn-helix (wHTH) protein